MDDRLHRAAWGTEPGMWPLPAASTVRGRWNRAVALGGQGRYLAASAELDAAVMSGPVPPSLRSQMHSTRASWIRQMGAHGAAARVDGTAIAAVGLDERRSPSGETGDDPAVVRARADALVGLAADALGVGRFGTADALLARCEHMMARDGRKDVLWRQHLRLGWVRAELAMFSGRGPDAVRYALDARGRADEIDSLRHTVKTDLVLAAAYSSVGDLSRSGDGAQRVLDACEVHGLLPLRWAAAMLWSGVGGGAPARSVAQECEMELARRGGRFTAV
ncbi:hypothetical protein [Rhodococcoides fascians]|jgi:hypothetical protein|uniref:hypothetical protein n=1 Tax=Rhodococcoides fascians TaxID=1828 RepID=UPI000562F12E|nr:MULTISPECIES: hypothetical protein [Rhodococcus]OZF06464.1 hypothetical protein CH301_01370 [Rhodococcus sp. 15-1189-1-1a]OZF22279.1 hypothetical protein CH299_01370 [Rhodococcus sp. 14-2686-1-2]